MQSGHRETGVKVVQGCYHALQTLASFDRIIAETKSLAVEGIENIQKIIDPVLETKNEVSKKLFAAEMIGITENAEAIRTFIDEMSLEDFRKIKNIYDHIKTPAMSSCPESQRSMTLALLPMTSDKERAKIVLDFLFNQQENGGKTLSWAVLNYVKIDRLKIEVGIPLSFMEDRLITTPLKSPALPEAKKLEAGSILATPVTLTKSRKRKEREEEKDERSPLSLPFSASSPSQVGMFRASSLQAAVEGPSELPRGRPASPSSSADSAGSTPFATRSSPPITNSLGC